MKKPHFLITKNLEMIMENMDEIFLFIGTDTTILYANPAYSRLIGVPRDKVIGRLLRDIEPEARIIEVLETERPVFQDYSFIESVGMDIIGNMFPVYHGEEKAGAMAVFRPVSLFSSTRSDHAFAKALPDRTVPEQDDPFNKIIGQSQELLSKIHMAKKVANTDATLLIRGETGVGKEVFARAIHESSPLCDAPFIALNMASIPETLIESELFGYEAGAFTGAHRSGKPGLFEMADGGTLFLDEIGEMSPALQSKLLRVIQEREVTRVGGTKPRAVRFRLITATNRNLESMVENGKFRPDLYYRVSVIPLYLPPLRDRSSDILLLSEHFKVELERRYKEKKVFSPRYLDRLRACHWPGNVRELHSCIEYSFLLSEGQLLDVQHLPPQVWGAPPPEKRSHSSMAEQTVSNLKERLEQVEKEMIQKVLADSKTKTEAIKRLGISRKGFYLKLKKYGFTV